MTKTEKTKCCRFAQFIIKSKLGFVPSIDQIILLEAGITDKTIDNVFFRVGAQHYRVSRQALEFTDKSGFILFQI